MRHVISRQGSYAVTLSSDILFLPGGPSVECGESSLPETTFFRPFQLTPGVGCLDLLSLQS